MASVAELTAEMRFARASFYAEWTWARVAACPWWAVLRRAALARQALLHEREASRWYEELTGRWPVPGEVVRDGGA